MPLKIVVFWRWIFNISTLHVVYALLEAYYLYLSNLSVQASTCCAVLARQMVPKMGTATVSFILQFSLHGDCKNAVISKLTVKTLYSSTQYILHLLDKAFRSAP